MKRKSNDVYYSIMKGYIYPYGTPLHHAPEEAIFNLWTGGAATAMKNSAWWQGLKITPTGTDNRAKKIVEQNKKMLSADPQAAPLSIKACPPVKEVLARSLVITAPCDIHFAATTSHDIPELVIEKGSRDHPPVPLWQYKFADPVMEATYGGTHPPVQYESSTSSAFKNMTNLKIQTGIVLSLPDGWHSMMMGPFFDYPDSPWRHIPGIHYGGLAKSIHVIWNVMVPKGVKSFEINAGDPMAYVLFSDRPKRFIHHPEPWKAHTFKRKMFSAATSFEAVGNIVKRKFKVGEDND